ncbi:hypothetical protein WI40_07825 [Burkholderia ubonensis]|nr:hypothetical protein WI40_07825 [Burkholderia ubonensis]
MGPVDERSGTASLDSASSGHGVTHDLSSGGRLDRRGTGLDVEVTRDCVVVTTDCPGAGTAGQGLQPTEASNTF